MGVHGEQRRGRRTGTRAAVVAAVALGAVALLVGVGTAATPLLAALPATHSVGSLLDPGPGGAAGAADPGKDDSTSDDSDDSDDSDKPPCLPTVRACVDLTKERAWLMDKGKVVRGPVEIVTGDSTDPTPKGSFTVQWKAAQYTSREYHVQMPWSVFFAPGGIAFHQGNPSSPSAGCVKLSPENAHAFFQFLNVGDPVQVV